MPRLPRPAIRCWTGHAPSPLAPSLHRSRRHRRRRILQRRAPLRRRFATPPPPPLRGVEDSPPPALTPILQPHEVGGRCRAQRGGGGDPAAPSRYGRSLARPAWRGLTQCFRASTARRGPARPARPGRPPPSRRSETGGLVAPPPSRRPNLRHPGTAFGRSAGRRIRDPCLAVHAGDPVHDEARAAAAMSQPTSLSTSAEAWIPDLPFRCAPATPGATGGPLPYGFIRKNRRNRLVPFE